MGTTTDTDRRRAAVDGVGPLESSSVSWVRSTRVRRYAVILVALIVVVWAVRFVFGPIPDLPAG